MDKKLYRCEACFKRTGRLDAPRPYEEHYVECYNYLREVKMDEPKQMETAL